MKSDTRLTAIQLITVKKPATGRGFNQTCIDFSLLW